MESIFTSTEFYVIAFTIAISIIALVARPAKRGEAFTYLFSGNIIPASSQHLSPSLTISGMDNGMLRIIHHQVPVTEKSRINIDLTVIGTDLRIEEKPLPILYDEGVLCDVEYIIDTLRSERYHLYFDSPSLGIYATTYLRNSPNYHSTTPFSQ